MLLSIMPRLQSFNCFAANTFWRSERVYPTRKYNKVADYLDFALS